MLIEDRKFGTTGYVFSDDTVNDSIGKVEMICDVLSSLPFKIEWVSYARPDMFYSYPEMAPMLINSGARGLFLGIETLCHRAGITAGKGLHPEKIREVLSSLRQHAGGQCFLLGSFIIGLVGETEDSLSQTLEFLCQQKVFDMVQAELLFVSNDVRRINSSFSTDPQKFGFTKMVWDPEYDWEHQTLNYKQCKRITKKWQAELENHSFSVFCDHRKQTANFWSYPMVRSLGFSHPQAIEFLKKNVGSNLVFDAYTSFTNSYHATLRSHWRSQRVDTLTH